MPKILWSKEELSVLKKVYPLYLDGTISQDEIVKIFPCRTISALQGRASRMKITITKGKINKTELKNLYKMHRM